MKWVNNFRAHLLVVLAVGNTIMSKYPNFHTASPKGKPSQSLKKGCASTCVANTDQYRIYNIHTTNAGRALLHFPLIFTFLVIVTLTIVFGAHIPILIKATVVIEITGEIDINFNIP